MDFPEQRIKRIVDELKGISDPTDRALATGAMLEAVPTLQRELREIRQAAVGELRAQGLSHGDVAQALGITRARAQQIYKGQTSGHAPKTGSDS